jgi:glycosyltransferase involved in cell wall biosynthesis
MPGQLMHVGLNMAFLTPGEMGGLEVYARELTTALAQRDDVRLTLLMNELLTRDPLWERLGEPVLVRGDPRRRLDWVRADQTRIPRVAARAGVDVVHSLASTAPLYGRFARVTTIHDLNYKLVPDSHFGLRGAGMRVLVPAAARRSHRLLTGSESTRSDLVRYLGVAPEKIDVAPHGVLVSSDIAPTSAEAIRAQLDLGERPFVLSVSAKRPHKNLPRLFRALAAIPAERRPALVVPGYPTPHEEELHALAAELEIREDVRMPAWLSAADLEGLYREATFAVFPSLYEGFGLPVLEAMARGVPVASSNRSSLPEVAGDAALLFDPESVEEIRDAMERLFHDSALAERLRTAGREQAARFTWAQSADLTVASYRRALGARE